MDDMLPPSEQNEMEHDGTHDRHLGSWDLSMLLESKACPNSARTATGHLKMAVSIASLVGIVSQHISALNYR